jgi:hypothetical protein
LTIRGSLISKNKPVGILDSSNVSEPPSFVVEPEPVVPTPRREGVVDIYADDETEDASRHLTFAEEDTDDEDNENVEHDYPDDEDEEKTKGKASMIYFSSPIAPEKQSNKKVAKEKRSKAEKPIISSDVHSGHFLDASNADAPNIDAPVSDKKRKSKERSDKPKKKKKKSE